MMHHRMQGQMMSQSQEEMAIIGIVALLWIGKSFRSPDYSLQSQPIAHISSFPCGIQIVHEARRRQRTWGPTGLPGTPGMARSLSGRRRLLHIRGVLLFLIPFIDPYHVHLEGCVIY